MTQAVPRAATESGATPTPTDTRVRRLLETPWSLALLASLPTIPGIWLSYGTDIDIANVLRAGQSAIDGDYSYSRPPGALPHEVATRAIDLVAGSAGVALASVVLGFVTLYCVGWLIRDEGRSPTLPVLLVASNPWWWVAATSLGDFIWALAGVSAGAVLSRLDRRALAGILFGLAIGVRASSVLLVLAWLAAEQLGRTERRSWSPTVITLATAGVTAVAVFVPSWLAADRTLAFVSNEFEVTGPFVLIGRWVVKNIAFFGVVSLVILAAGYATILRCLREWTSSTVVRFGVLGLLATELLFLRFPWKPAHLLPALVCLALVLSASARWRWGALLIAGGLLHGAVALTVAAPDVPHRATTADISFALVPGVIVNDVQCRLDDLDRGPWPDPASVEAGDRTLALFDCQGAIWRSPP
jgi:hypothetical protein